MSYIKVFTFGKAHGKVNNIEIMKTTQGNNINRKNKVEQVMDERKTRNIYVYLY